MKSTLCVVLILLILIMVPNGCAYLEDYNFLRLKDCICLPQHLCRDNIPDFVGYGSVDIRNLKSRPCANYNEICCKNPTKIIKTEQPLIEDTGLNPFKECGYGRATSEPDYRILGNDSSNAKFAEFPWAVIILRTDFEQKKSIYKCGGSIIHPRVILTAAHCIDEQTNGYWIVRAGEWDTRIYNEPLPYQDKLVAEFFMHPHYHSASLKNDIALLFLREPFELAENVRTVCLPSSELSLNDDDAKCIACGWGKDAFKNGHHSTILKKIEIPIVAKSDCLKSLRTTRLGKFYNLHRSFICAGGEVNKDACKGDGGSPLVCPMSMYNRRYFQAGIVSWGIGCGAAGIPGVYVNVALYSEWIDTQLRVRNLDTVFYKYK